MRSLIFYFIGIFILCSTMSWAEEGLSHVHGTHEECPLPKSAQDILLCAREMHPDAKRAKLNLEAAKVLPELAGQIPNPQLQGQAAIGSQLGDRLIQSQFVLSQPIELGGKRSARIQNSKAQGTQARADLGQTQSEITLKTVLNLHLARQLVQEKVISESAIQTFNRLVTQYQSRPRLSPEQEISLAIFEMALADQRMKLSAILVELGEVEHFFHIAVGHSLDEIKNVLPPSPKSWPEIADKKKADAFSAKIFRLMADRDLSIAQLESARANSWPGLQIGPLVQYQYEGPIQGQLYGIQLNLELPIFSTNGGGRAFAHKTLLRAEGSLELQKAEETHERAERIRAYRSALAALDEVPATSQLVRKYKRAQELSLRGLIPSSLIVEMQRQRFDLEKNRNERELKALEALWNVYQIDGKILEKKI